MTAYRILEQAPTRIFAAAAVAELARAKLPPGPANRETATVFSFVLPHDTSPAWAKARLAALAG